MAGRGVGKEGKGGGGLKIFEATNAHSRFVSVVLDNVLLNL